MTIKEILTIATQLKGELDMMNYRAKDGTHYEEYRRSSNAIRELLENLKIDVVVNFSYDSDVDKVIATLVYVRIPKTDKIVFMPCFYSKFDEKIYKNLFEAVDTFKSQGAICCRCDYTKCTIGGKWGE